jgi:hypothetical protein
MARSSRERHDGYRRRDWLCVRVDGAGCALQLLLLLRELFALKSAAGLELLTGT